VLARAGVAIRLAPRVGRYRLLEIGAAPVGRNRVAAGLFFQRREPLFGRGIAAVVEPVVVETEPEQLDLGARRVILGSSLIKGGAIDTEFAEQCAASIGAERLTFAIDSRGGKVSIKGWKEGTSIDPLAMVRLLDPFCRAFLYTHIDTEGTMNGFPMEVAERLRKATARQMIVAGGIRSMDEVTQLEAMNVDAVVGMAIYTDAIKA